MDCRYFPHILITEQVMPTTDDQDANTDAVSELPTEEQIDADMEEFVDILFKKWENERKSGNAQIG